MVYGILSVLTSGGLLLRGENLTSARDRRVPSHGKHVYAVLPAARWIVAIALLLLPGWAAAKAGGLAYSVTIAEVIDTAASNTFERAIEEAGRQEAEVVMLRLDTPGGNERPMRAMLRTIAAAPMPVIVYVHPNGARADSAGAVLTLAADVAAMAPQTNISSATPVLIAPPPLTRSEEQTLRDLRRKAINDGVALVRGLTENHGRNADLAERMVRKAENVTAIEAHKQGLIDVLAENEQALLRSLDGFTVKGSKAQRLQTSGLEIKQFVDAAIDTGDSGDLDESSWWRSTAYVFGGSAIIAMALLGWRPASRSWRRRQRRRRRARRQQR